MKMSMEHLSNNNDRERRKCSKKNLFQCYFFHHKYHMGWPMIEHCFCREKQAANHLSHGTALRLISVCAPSL
jgi:hypothetical protein